MPSHAHPFKDYYYPENSRTTGDVPRDPNPQNGLGSHSTDWDNDSVVYYIHNTDVSGGDIPHNNIQPSIITHVWERIG